MSSESKATRPRPWYRKKRFLIPVSFLFIAGVAGFFIYNNFNKLLSEALRQAFNKTLISDVYELNFKHLHVNLADGNITVKDVVFQPREKPLEDYPYINSSVRLTTEKLVLRHVKVFQLLETQTLDLDKIEIDNPEVELTLNGKVSVLFPFKDSTSVNSKHTTKQALESFHLMQFRLEDASFKVINNYKKTDFEVSDFDFAFNELSLSQNVGSDNLQCESVNISVGSLSGILLESPLKNVTLKNYKFSVADLKVQKSIDTLIYHFTDFESQFNDLDVQTADSLFHITVKNFGIRYSDKSMKLDSVVFQPNLSEAEMTKRSSFQSTQFSAKIESVEMLHIDFDSLIYYQYLNIDTVIVNKAMASLFKDKTKPLDTKKFPGYPGQNVRQINFPIKINTLVVKDASLVNRERKPDRTYAKVTVAKLNAVAANFNTMDSTGFLTIEGGGLLEHKANFQVKLVFDYAKPQFSIDANVKKFNLEDLNPLLQSYTPGKINSGIVDVLSFTAMAYKTKSTGTLKFLYHDLNVDLELKEKAQWKNTIGALAANIYLNAANPASENVPAKVVKFEAERNMNKGFINIVLKSLFAGLKETLVTSKENRKAYHQKKKAFQEKRKQ